MLVRQKIFAVLVAVALFLFIIELVRKKKVRIEYSYIWMLTGTGILILAVWYDLLIWITNLIGAVLPTTTLFLFALIFIIIICIHFSVRISSLSDQTMALAQEIALLKNQLESTRNTPDESKTST